MSCIRVPTLYAATHHIRLYVKTALANVYRCTVGYNSIVNCMCHVSMHHALSHHRLIKQQRFSQHDDKFTISAIVKAFLPLLRKRITPIHLLNTCYLFCPVAEISHHLCLFERRASHISLKTVAIRAETILSSTATPHLRWSDVYVS